MYIINYTSDDFKSNLSKSEVVIIPVGMVEAHGHHMPLGTDIFSPRLFCQMLEERIGDKIWIAPEIPYGQSFDLSFYSGTFSVPSEVMADYVYHIGKSMYENGLKKLIFINGHGGNATALGLASQKLVELGMDVMISNWWVDYSKEILTICEGQGHAGEDETSAVLYYDEKFVQMDKAMKNNKKPVLRINFRDRGRILYENALSGDATLATREKGEKIFKLLTDKLVETIEAVIEGKYYIEE
jgi:creatinine amidohydrolase